MKINSEFSRETAFEIRFIFFKKSFFAICYFLALHRQIVMNPVSSKIGYNFFTAIKCGLFCV